MEKDNEGLFLHLPVHGMSQIIHMLKELLAAVIPLECDDIRLLLVAIA